MSGQSTRMIAVRGAGSRIAEELDKLIDDPMLPVKRHQDMPTNADRYLFCAGLLRGKRAEDQTAAEIEEGRRVNLWQITDDCERILSANPKARICVIGSESAYRGSYDGIYAASKLALHEYVERKRLKPGQQLVCISPGVIEDCAMVTGRCDTWRLDERRERHPQKRFLKAAEVAKLVHFVLYEDAGYLSNVVVRLNGGEHTI